MVRAALAQSAVVSAIAFGATQSTADRPVVAVTIDDSQQLAALTLIEVKDIVAAIYAAAGVTIVWRPESALDARRELTIAFTTSEAAPAGGRRDVMGVAPSPGDGTRGDRAYVFVDRVDDFVGTYSLNRASVLACAVAHELGHLLLPVMAHRPDGIMRATWHPDLFPPRAPGLLGFPSDQARLLALRVRTAPATPVTR